MAHHKRKKPRTRTYARGSAKGRERRLIDKGQPVPEWPWIGTWPAFWDILRHSRPRRRETSRLARAVLMGWVDPDDAAWPLGNHKPHIYYW